MNNKPAMTYFEPKLISEVLNRLGLLPLFKVLLLIMVSVLAGCASVPESSNLDSLIQQRTQLQTQLARLSDIWWERTGVLAEVDHSLPLISRNPNTLQTINRNLTQQIETLQTSLTQLDKQVTSRKVSDEVRYKVALKLIDAEWLNSDGGDLDVESSAPLIRVAGERGVWQIPSLSGEPLSLMVTLSEKGTLFVEGQNILSVRDLVIGQPFVTQVTLYQEQLLPQGQLLLTLVSEE